MLATPSLRWVKIAMILLLVSKTLLLSRNNCILFYQSSNFVLSLSNHPGSGIILFSVTVYTFPFVIAGAGAADTSLSDHLYILSEALSVICKDPSLSDNASISFVCFELILVLLVVYTTCVLFFVWQ